MKNAVITGALLAMTFTLLTGCQSNDPGENTGQSGNKTVVVAGSTSVQPLSEMLAEKFMEKNNDITIEIQGGGSGQGIKAIEEKIADFGSLSREVKDDETSSITNEDVIARDGIAVIVNSGVDVNDVTMDQLKDIYTGKITNWKELGGKDSEIVVVSREEGSGTRGSFIEITGVLKKEDNGQETDNTVSTSLIQGSTGAVTQTVAATPDSIGYISLGSLDNTVKSLKVNGVEATEENVLSEEYELARPFLYVSGTELSESARKFLDYILSDEGQAIVEDAGFISVNKAG